MWTRRIPACCPASSPGTTRTTQCHIDLRPLARFAGARLIHDEAIGLDTAERRVSCRARAPVPMTSSRSTSAPRRTCARSRAPSEYATPVKPIDGLAARWAEIVERTLDGRYAPRFLTVGGGAAGVELTLAMQYRLRALLGEQGRDPDGVSFTLVTLGQILPGHNRVVRDWFREHLKARGVQRHRAQRRARGAGAALFVCADGQRLGFDELIWVTEAGAASWLADSGLALDEGGFIKIDATLRSVSDPHVFAAGDVASNVDHPRPKAGVFAVRQGPPLADNLRRALAGEPLAPFVPQSKFLSLITTGDRYAVASRGWLAAQGRLLWYWKDWIDRSWMRQYQELPARVAASEATGQE